MTNDTGITRELVESMTNLDKGIASRPCTRTTPSRSNEIPGDSHRCRWRAIIAQAGEERTRRRIVTTSAKNRTGQGFVELVVRPPQPGQRKTTAVDEGLQRKGLEISPYCVTYDTKWQTGLKDRYPNHHPAKKSLYPILNFSLLDCLVTLSNNNNASSFSSIRS